MDAEFAPRHVLAKQYLSICTEQSDRYGNRQVRYAASRCERT